MIFISIIFRYWSLSIGTRSIEGHDCRLTFIFIHLCYEYTLWPVRTKIILILCNTLDIASLLIGF